ncbi:tail fiber assembly protein [Pseudomonas donghuensis]|uniref:tail fiber assembly protein n=1 Tax=Pseudomonas donghuensis TaxID=1163398 RepID=UPI002E1016C8|nr:tail fiber assembly protein [Pseudomonas donghuensis]
MPYAANGVVSTVPLPGSIEISQAQYQEAIEGMGIGKVVSIEGGFLVAFPPIPEAPVIAPPTLDEMRVMVISRRDSLLAIAAVRMAPLQDAVELGVVTADERAALEAWKRYRIDLNRVELQAGFPRLVEWPASPDVFVAL